MTLGTSDQVKDIGERLQALRYALGYGGGRRTAAFCRTYGFSPTQWHNYVSGERRINLDEALKLASGTGATLEWIYRGDEWLWTMPGKLANDIRAAREQITRENS
ncbi:helix-turn-helix domain-containing protein [Microvirga aerophila]|uniref:HTH cro/C1-type domain-containing protein n=1 Tax=Microvirga aerophila TaxID=670291 RepID=A0A512C1L2_9HYPH|nr:helix-turn-helix transcriptional regulator [Microvirga aerophila]GEO18083.1 hypothetical protein MAE02_57790 [Microvirga aerophila]